MKALVLFSGGLDSSVCLGMAVEKYGADEVMALSINYGQKHDKELLAAKNVVAYYGVEYRELNLKWVFEGSDCSLLKSNDAEIPQGEYAEQLKGQEGAPVSTFVPYRNGLFLSTAAAIAVSRDCDKIYFGGHADDSAGNAYPDTSVEFFEAIAEAIRLGSGNETKLIAPFIDKSKAEIVRVGAEIGVPFELTWSCYEGNDKACGKCGTCIDRLKAFAENGLTDPIEYEEK